MKKLEDTVKERIEYKDAAKNETQLNNMSSINTPLTFTKFDQ